MPVRVSIDTGDNTMELTRAIDFLLLGDSPAVGFRKAARLLREIADDIDRMYPPPKDDYLD